MTGPAARRAIVDLPIYAGGESEAPGVTRTIKLSSNESPLGPATAALDAYRQTAAALHHYPDGGSVALRKAIAQHHDLNMEQVVCGAGSEELLEVLAHAYLEPGDEVVHSEFGFPMYRIAAIGAGASPVTARETDYRADVDALLDAVTPRTRILFLANPNNPTGTVLPFQEIERLHAALRGDVLLVLDAAYAEYQESSDYDSGIRLVRDGAENVVVTRTFSKIHALASLRVGWAYGHHAIATAMNRVRRHFNVNGPAQAAARAALSDAAHIRHAVEHNTRWRPWLEREVHALGLRTTASVANFILIVLGEDSRAAFEFLKLHGIITRPGAPYGIPDGLRVTVGTEQDNAACVAALAAYLQQRAAGIR
jgi:histidinol-phosphate aminotransferase